MLLYIFISILHCFGKFCEQDLQNFYGQSGITSSLGPTQKYQENGLVTHANFLVCADSAYYVTIT